MARTLLLLTTLWLALTDRLSRPLERPLGRPRRGGRDRGDVPGWVMVTIMSAALAVALITIAGPRLKTLFTNSVDSVSNTKSP